MSTEHSYERSHAFSAELDTLNVTCTSPGCGKKTAQFNKGLIPRISADHSCDE